MNNQSIYNQDIYKIAEKIYNKLGSGHTEFIYHRAMEIELRLNRYNYETEKRVLIIYEDDDGNKYSLGEERIDIYIHQKNIIIELKAVVNKPKETEISQVYKYHRELSKLGVNVNYGIIINFPQAGAKPANKEIDFNVALPQEIIHQAVVPLSNLVGCRAGRDL